MEWILSVTSTLTVMFFSSGTNLLHQIQTSVSEILNVGLAAGMTPALFNVFSNNWATSQVVCSGKEVS